METRKNLRKVALLAGAALLSAGAVAMPPAEQHVMQTDTVTQTEIVKYNVPESSTREGARKLYRKLQAAAYRVCTSDQQALGHFPDSSCVASALGKAVAEIASESLSALHLQKQAGSSKLAATRKASSIEPETLANR